jgi:hypothetical protein
MIVADAGMSHEVPQVRDPRYHPGNLPATARTKSRSARGSPAAGADLFGFGLNIRPGLSAKSERLN